MPPVSPRTLALAAFAGLIALAGCPAPGGVGATPSPEGTKKKVSTASKGPSKAPSSSPTPRGTAGPAVIPTGTPSPTPTATVAPAGTPTPAGTATPTPTPTATATATTGGADAAAITAATAFPFKTVGQTWTYDTSLSAAIATLAGTRVITVKAVTATNVTVNVKNTTDTSTLPFGADGVKTTEKDVVVLLTAADPYFVIEAELGGFATVAPGASTFAAKTEKVLTVDTPVIVRSYSVPAPAEVQITNTLTADKGLVGATLKGSKLPPDLNAPIPNLAYTITTTLKTYAATTP